MVASSAGGIPEVVEDGVTGFLHPPKEVEAMAHSAVKLLSDEGLLEQFSQAARERAVTVFSEKVVLPLYEQVYDEALSRRSGSSGK